MSKPRRNQQNLEMGAAQGMALSGKRKRRGGEGGDGQSAGGAHATIMDESEQVYEEFKDVFASIPSSDHNDIQEISGAVALRNYQSMKDMTTALVGRGTKRIIIKVDNLTELCAIFSLLPRRMRTFRTSAKTCLFPYITSAILGKRNLLSFKDACQRVPIRFEVDFFDVFGEVQIITVQTFTNRLKETNEHVYTDLIDLVPTIFIQVLKTVKLSGQRSGYFGHIEAFADVSPDRYAQIKALYKPDNERKGIDLELPVAKRSRAGAVQRKQKSDEGEIDAIDPKTGEPFTFTRREDGCVHRPIGWFTIDIRQFMTKVMSGIFPKETYDPEQDLRLEPSPVPNFMDHYSNRLRLNIEEMVQIIHPLGWVRDVTAYDEYLVSVCISHPDFLDEYHRWLELGKPRLKIIYPSTGSPPDFSDLNALATPPMDFQERPRMHTTVPGMAQHGDGGDIRGVAQQYDRATSSAGGETHFEFDPSALFDQEHAELVKKTGGSGGEAAQEAEDESELPPIEKIRRKNVLQNYRWMEEYGTVLPISTDQPKKSACPRVSKTLPPPSDIQTRFQTEALFKKQTEGVANPLDEADTVLPEGTNLESEDASGAGDGLDTDAPGASDGLEADASGAGGSHDADAPGASDGLEADASGAGGSHDAKASVGTEQAAWAQNYDVGGFTGEFDDPDLRASLEALDNPVVPTSFQVLDGSVVSASHQAVDDPVVSASVHLLGVIDNILADTESGTELDVGAGSAIVAHDATITVALTVSTSNVPDSMDIDQGKEAGASIDGSSRPTTADASAVDSAAALTSAVVSGGGAPDVPAADSTTADASAVDSAAALTSAVVSGDGAPDVPAADSTTADASAVDSAAALTSAVVSGDGAPGAPAADSTTADASAVDSAAALTSAVVSGGGAPDAPAADSTTADASAVDSAAALTSAVVSGSGALDAGVPDIGAPHAPATAPIVYVASREDGFSQQDVSGGEDKPSEKGGPVGDNAYQNFHLFKEKMIDSYKEAFRSFTSEIAEKIRDTSEMFDGYEEDIDRKIAEYESLKIEKKEWEENKAKRFDELNKEIEQLSQRNIAAMESYVAAETNRRIDVLVEQLKSSEARYRGELTKKVEDDIEKVCRDVSSLKQDAVSCAKEVEELATDVIKVVSAEAAKQVEAASTEAAEIRRVASAEAAQQVEAATAEVTRLREESIRLQREHAEIRGKIARAEELRMSLEVEITELRHVRHESVTRNNGMNERYQKALAFVEKAAECKRQQDARDKALASREALLSAREAELLPLPTSGNPANGMLPPRARGGLRSCPSPVDHLSLSNDASETLDALCSSGDGNGGGEGSSGDGGCGGGCGGDGGGGGT
jgi:hypothetical protein